MLVDWSNTTAAFVSSILLSALITRKVTQLFPSSHPFKICLITFCILFNPYAYSLFEQSITDSVQQLSLFLAILLLNSTSHFQYLFLGLATGINPAYLPLSIFIMRFAKPIKKGVTLLFFGVLIGLILISKGDWSQILQNYKAQFFPQTFEIQFNMFWGILAHMFDRYVILYELVFALVNLISLYLVNHIVIAKPVKIMVLLFFKQYQLCFLNSLFIQSFLLAKYLPDLIEKLKNHNKTFEIGKIQILGTVWAVVGFSFFIFNKLLIQKYYNDFTINTGYLQIYITLIWVARAIFLSELINTSVSLQKDEKSCTLKSASSEQSNFEAQKS